MELAAVILKNNSLRQKTAYIVQSAAAKLYTKSPKRCHVTNPDVFTLAFHQIQTLVEESCNHIESPAGSDTGTH